MLTRITDWKIPCVYIHVYQITKNWGPGPYNSLRHADNRKYFLGLTLMWNRREAHMFYLARKVRRIWRCSCLEKGDFIMINEFKYCQTWTFWPCSLSLSLCSTFRSFCKYYFGRCSSEMAQLVPLTFFRGRSTHYSDRLHDFSVTIPRCYKDVYVSSFFPPTGRLWNSLPIECFPLTYDLSGVKSRINRYLLTVVSF